MVETQARAPQQEGGPSQAEAAVAEAESSLARLIAIRSPLPNAVAVAEQALRALTVEAAQIDRQLAQMMETEAADLLRSSLVDLTHGAVEQGERAFQGLRTEAARLNEEMARLGTSLEGTELSEEERQRQTEELRTLGEQLNEVYRQLEMLLQEMLDSVEPMRSQVQPSDLEAFDQYVNGLRSLLAEVSRLHVEEAEGVGAVEEAREERPAPEPTQPVEAEGQAAEVRTQDAQPETQDTEPITQDTEPGAGNREQDAGDRVPAAGEQAAEEQVPASEEQTTAPVDAETQRRLQTISEGEQLVAAVLERETHGRGDARFLETLRQMQTALQQMRHRLQSPDQAGSVTEEQYAGMCDSLIYLQDMYQYISQMPTDTAAQRRMRDGAEALLSNVLRGLQSSAPQDRIELLQFMVQEYLQTDDQSYRTRLVQLSNGIAGVGGRTVTLEDATREISDHLVREGDAVAGRLAGGAFVDVGERLQGFIQPLRREGAVEDETSGGGTEAEVAIGQLLRAREAITAARVTADEIQPAIGEDVQASANAMEIVLRSLDAVEQGYLDTASMELQLARQYARTADASERDATVHMSRNVYTAMQVSVVQQLVMPAGEEQASLSLEDAVRRVAGEGGDTEALTAAYEAQRGRMLGAIRESGVREQAFDELEVPQEQRAGLNRMLDAVHERVGQLEAGGELPVEEEPRVRMIVGVIQETAGDEETARMLAQIYEYEYGLLGRGIESGASMAVRDASRYFSLGEQLAAMERMAGGDETQTPGLHTLLQEPIQYVREQRAALLRGESLSRDALMRLDALQTAILGNEEEGLPDLAARLQQTDAARRADVLAAYGDALLALSRPAEEGSLEAGQSLVIAAETLRRTQSADDAAQLTGLISRRRDGAVTQREFDEQVSPVAARAEEAEATAEEAREAQEQAEQQQRVARRTVVRLQRDMAHADALTREEGWGSVGSREAVIRREAYEEERAVRTDAADLMELEERAAQLVRGAQEAARREGRSEPTQAELAEARAVETQIRITREHIAEHQRRAEALGAEADELHRTGTCAREGRGRRHDPGMGTLSESVEVETEGDAHRHVYNRESVLRDYRLAIAAARRGDLQAAARYEARARAQMGLGHSAVQVARQEEDTRGERRSRLGADASDHVDTADFPRFTVTEPNGEEQQYDPNRRFADAHSAMLGLIHIGDELAAGRVSVRTARDQAGSVEEDYLSGVDRDGFWTDIGAGHIVQQGLHRRAQALVQPPSVAARMRAGMSQGEAELAYARDMELARQEGAVAAAGSMEEAGDRALRSAEEAEAAYRSYTDHRSFVQAQEESDADLASDLTARFSRTEEGRMALERAREALQRQGVQQPSGAELYAALLREEPEMLQQVLGDMEESEWWSSETDAVAATWLHDLRATAFRADGEARQERNERQWAGIEHLFTRARRMLEAHDQDDVELGGVRLGGSGADQVARVDGATRIVAMANAFSRYIDDPERFQRMCEGREHLWLDRTALEYGEGEGGSVTSGMSGQGFVDFIPEYQGVVRSVMQHEAALTMGDTGVAGILPGVAAPYVFETTDSHGERREWSPEERAYYQAMRTGLAIDYAIFGVVPLTEEERQRMIDEARESGELLPEESVPYARPVAHRDSAQLATALAAAQQFDQDYAGFRQEMIGVRAYRESGLSRAGDYTWGYGAQAAAYVLPWATGLPGLLVQRVAESRLGRPIDVQDYLRRYGERYVADTAARQEIRPEDIFGPGQGYAGHFARMERVVTALARGRITAEEAYAQLGEIARETAPRTPEGAEGQAGTGAEGELARRARLGQHQRSTLAGVDFVRDTALFALLGPYGWTYGAVLGIYGALDRISRARGYEHLGTTEQETAFYRALGLSGGWERTAVYAEFWAGLALSLVPVGGEIATETQMMGRLGQGLMGGGMLLGGAALGMTSAAQMIDWDRFRRESPGASAWSAFTSTRYLRSGVGELEFLTAGLGNIAMGPTQILAMHAIGRAFGSGEMRLRQRALAGDEAAQMRIVRPPLGRGALMWLMGQHPGGEGEAPIHEESARAYRALRPEEQLAFSRFEMEYHGTLGAEETAGLATEYRSARSRLERRFGRDAVERYRTGEPGSAEAGSVEREIELTVQRARARRAAGERLTQVEAAALAFTDSDVTRHMEGTRLHAPEEALQPAPERHPALGPYRTPGTEAEAPGRVVEAEAQRRTDAEAQAHADEATAPRGEEPGQPAHDGEAPRLTRLGLREEQVAEAVRRSSHELEQELADAQGRGTGPNLERATEARLDELLAAYDEWRRTGTVSPERIRGISQADIILFQELGRGDAPLSAEGLQQLTRRAAEMAAVRLGLPSSGAALRRMDALEQLGHQMSRRTIRMLQDESAQMRFEDLAQTYVEYVNSRGHGLSDSVLGARLITPEDMALFDDLMQRYEGTGVDPAARDAAVARALGDRAVERVFTNMRDRARAVVARAVAQEVGSVAAQRRAVIPEGEAARAQEQIWGTLSQRTEGLIRAYNELSYSGRRSLSREEMGQFGVTREDVRFLRELIARETARHRGTGLPAGLSSLEVAGELVRYANSGRPITVEFQEGAALTQETRTYVRTTAEELLEQGGPVLAAREESRRFGFDDRVYEHADAESAAHAAAIAEAITRMQRRAGREFTAEDVSELVDRLVPGEFTDEQAAATEEIVGRLLQDRRFSYTIPTDEVGGEAVIQLRHEQLRMALEAGDQVRAESNGEGTPVVHEAAAPRGEVEPAPHAEGHATPAPEVRAQDVQPETQDTEHRTQDAEPDAGNREQDAGDRVPAAESRWRRARRVARAAFRAFSESQSVSAFGAGALDAAWEAGAREMRRPQSAPLDLAAAESRVSGVYTAHCMRRDSNPDYEGPSYAGDRQLVEYIDARIREGTSRAEAIRAAARVLAEARAQGREPVWTTEQPQVRHEAEVQPEAHDAGRPEVQGRGARAAPQVGEEAHGQPPGRVRRFFRRVFGRESQDAEAVGAAVAHPVQDARTVQLMDAYVQRLMAHGMDEPQARAEAERFREFSDQVSFLYTDDPGPPDPNFDFEYARRMRDDHHLPQEERNLWRQRIEDQKYRVFAGDHSRRMRQLMQEFPEAFRPVRSFEQDGRRVEIGSPMRVGGRGGNDLVIPVYIYDEQGRPHITMAYTSQSHATYRRMTGYFVDRIYKGPVSQHFQNFDWHIQRELDRVVSGRRPIAVERGGQQLDLLEFGMRPPGHDGASRPRSYDAFDGILQGFMRNEDMLQRSMQRDTEPVDMSQPGNQPSRVVAHWEAESEFYGRYVRAVVSSENGRYQYVVAITEDGIFLQQVQDTRSGRVTLAGSPERGVLLTDRSLLTPIIDYTGEGEGATLLGADRAGTVQGRGARQRLLNLHTSEVSPLFGLQNGLDGVLRALRDGDMRSVDQQLAAMEHGQIPCISTERPVQRSDEEVRPAAESRLDRLREAFRIYQESRDAQGNLSEEHVSQLRAMGITQSDIDYFRTYSGFPDQIVERRLRTRAFRWARDHPEVRVAPREEATGGPRGAPAEARQPVPEVRQPVQPEQPQVRQEAEVRPEAHEAGRPAPVPGSAEDLRQRAEALHRQYAEYEDNLLSLLRTGTAPDAQTRARMAAAREEAVRLEQQAVLQDPESRAMLLINRGASAEELRREAAGSREYSHRMEEGLQGNGVGYLARRRSMIARAEAEARILEEAARAREEGRPYPPLAAEDIVTRLSHGMGNLDPNERAHAIDAFADMGRQEQESVLVGLRAAGRHGDALALEALMRDEDYHAARQSARRTGDRQHELDIIARYARLGQGAQAVVTAEPMRRDVIDATFGPILSGRSRSRDGETVRFSRGRGEPAVEYTRTEYERAAALALYVQEILSGARREGDSIPPELASRFRDLSSQDLQNAIGYLLADARSGADTRSQLAAAFDAIQGRELLFSRYETDLSYRRDDVEINSEALGDDEVRTRLPGMVGELMMRYQQNERFRNLIDERRAARARSEGHEISPDEEILHIAREYIYMDMQAQAPETQQPVPEVRQPVQPVGQEAPAQPAMQQPQSERDLSPISRDLYDVAQALLFRDPNGDMQRTGEVRRAGRHQFGRMSEEMQDAVLYMITGGSAYEQGDASARLWVAQVLGSSIETAGRTAVPSHDRLVQVAQAAYRVVYGGGSLDGSIITNTEEARAFGRFYRQMRAARQPVSIDDVVRVYETSRGVDSEAR